MNTVKSMIYVLIAESQDIKTAVHIAMNICYIIAERNARPNRGGQILTGCPRCGKPSKRGYKLCEEHYRLAVQALEKGRKNSKNTPFMQGNEGYWKMRQRFNVTK